MVVTCCTARRSRRATHDFKSLIPLPLIRSNNPPGRCLRVRNSTRRLKRKAALKIGLNNRAKRRSVQSALERRKKKNRDRQRKSRKIKKMNLATDNGSEHRIRRVLARGENADGVSVLVVDWEPSIVYQSENPHLQLEEEKHEVNVELLQEGVVPSFE